MQKSCAPRRQRRAQLKCWWCCGELNGLEAWATVHARTQVGQSRRFKSTRLKVRENNCTQTLVRINHLIALRLNVFGAQKLARVAFVQ